MGDVNSIGTARTIRTWPPTKLHLLNSKQLLNNEALDVDYELIDDEERYRSAGPTDGGRLLTVAWTIRNGKVRAITAFPASASDSKAFRERSK
jgi:uncharacterized DUF497 family protein